MEFVCVDVRCRREIKYKGRDERVVNKNEKLEMKLRKKMAREKSEVKRKKKSEKVIKKR